MARLLGSLASIWVVNRGWQSALPSIQSHVNRTGWGGGAVGGTGIGRSPEKSNSSCSGFLGSLLLVSSWWHHQVAGDWGPWQHGTYPKKGSCTAEIHRGILAPGAELPISVRRTSCMGILSATPGWPCWAPAFFCANSRWKTRRGLGTINSPSAEKKDQESEYVTSLSCFEDQRRQPRSFVSPQPAEKTLVSNSEKKIKIMTETIAIAYALLQLGKGDHYICHRHENCSQLQCLNKILWTKGASHNSNRTESG